MSRRFIFFVLSLAMVLSACQAAPAAAPTSAEPAAPSATVLPATATAEPSATPIPASPTPAEPTTPPATVTPEPSATPAVLSVLPDGFTAWCAHTDTLKADQPWVMPEKASAYTMVKDTPQLLMPNLGCTLVFTFNQSIPAGTALVAKDRGGNVWLKQELLAVSDDPTKGYIVLTHDYIKDPPQWEITYTFGVVNASGENVWESDVKLHDTNMPTWICVDGKLIDKRTKKCHWDIELHPWDKGYGTPGPNPY